MRRLFCHRNSVALAAALLLTAPLSGFQAADRTETASFTVLFQGRATGAENVMLTQSTAGWLISASGTLGPPIDVTTTRFLLRYTPDWQPQSLALEGMRGTQLFSLSTTFSLTTATSDAMQGGQQSSAIHQVSARTLVVPTTIYAPAYSVLAARLATAAVGTRFPVYVVPQGETTATVDRITPHRLTTGAGAVELREFDLTFANAGRPITVEVWTDAQNRLARVAIPSALIAVVRDDLSSVMTREETISRPGDEDVFAAAPGFNLSGTISKPKGVTGRGPAVVLVGAAGPQDRDERWAGIPMFGQIAGALADAGFVVMRYDKRGIGRSGGRPESAALAEYAGDAVSVVKALRKRADVDPDRIGVVGYAEGGAVALLAGTLDKRIAGIGLLAAPGQTGRAITLLQQQHALSRSTEPEASKTAKVDLELRFIDAVIKGTSWEGIPTDVQRQADTPWFKSWLLFDPAVTMAKVSQPLVIISGALDRQMPPSQADRLEALANARKKGPDTAARKVVVPGVNHLLVAATTGEEDEYRQLSTASVSPAVTSALAEWLKTALVKKK